MADPIQFERRTEAPSFFSPLAGMAFAEDRIEIRTDPLTGMTAIASAGLEAKEEMFLGRTDWEYMENCFCISYKVGYHFVNVKDGPGNAVLTQCGSDIGPTAVLVDDDRLHRSSSMVRLCVIL